MLSAAEMGTIKHPALVTDRADARIFRKYIKHFNRLRYFLLGGREGGVDDVDLRRMDRQHAAIAITPYFFRTGLQAFEITEIALDRFDRRHTGGRCAEQAHGPRQFIGEAIAAIVIAVAAGAADRIGPDWRDRGCRDEPGCRGDIAGV